MSIGGILRNVQRTQGVAISLRHVRFRATTSAAGLPDMPPCDFEPEPYKGISYDDAMKVRQKHMSPGLVTYYKTPIMINTGHRHWLWDTTGKRYLDMFGGIVTVSVGHCHPKVKEALRAQSEKLWHTTSIYLHPMVHEYTQKLVKRLPEHLDTVFFVNSGSEANDLALLMARVHTKSYDIISLRNAYHGTSPTTMGLTAHSNWKFDTPIGFGIHNTMNADVYRGPWGGARCKNSPVQTKRDCACAEGQCQACDQYLEQLEDVLRHSVTHKKVAGMFIEYIQGVGGSVQLPHGFMKKAFEIIKRRGGVCIADEVQTGFGRCGDHFWGFQVDGAEPDIVTMAKGIGNGFPLAAVATTKEIAANMTGTLFFNTYSGGPLACAVGSAVLDVLDEEKIQENAGVVGTHLLNVLEPLRSEFEIVGDVRGRGLMVGMEMVTDKESKTPLPAGDMMTIWENMKRHGLLVGKGGLYGNTFRLKPPMCVGKAEVDWTISVLRKSIQEFVDQQ